MRSGLFCTTKDHPPRVISAASLAAMLTAALSTAGANPTMRMQRRRHTTWISGTSSGF